MAITVISASCRPTDQLDDRAVIRLHYANPCSRRCPIHVLIVRDHLSRSSPILSRVDVVVAWRARRDERVEDVECAAVYEAVCSRRADRGVGAETSSWCGQRKAGGLTRTCLCHRETCPCRPGCAAVSTSDDPLHASPGGFATIATSNLSNGMGADGFSRMCH